MFEHKIIKAVVLSYSSGSFFCQNFSPIESYAAFDSACGIYYIDITTQELCVWWQTSMTCRVSRVSVLDPCLKRLPPKDLKISDFDDSFHLVIMQHIALISFPEVLRFIVNLILHLELCVCVLIFRFPYTYCPFNLFFTVLNIYLIILLLCNVFCALYKSLCVGNV